MKLIIDTETKTVQITENIKMVDMFWELQNLLGSKLDEYVLIKNEITSPVFTAPYPSPWFEWIPSEQPIYQTDWTLPSSPYCNPDQINYEIMYNMPSSICTLKLTNTKKKN